MAYLIPRAVILLIAWGTTTLMIRVFTGIDPLVFLLAGGVWSVVSLASFSYLDRVWDDDLPLRRAFAHVRRTGM